MEAGPVVQELGTQDGAPGCARVETQVPRLAHLGQTRERTLSGRDSREREQREIPGPWVGGLSRNRN